MDSMRSLNRSLPTSTPTQPPPEQLLKAFRQAALSVTNLYKAAASDQDSARRAGYQDALDDLLKFLDREDLGLQDGEGWKVREWVTARYDGTSATNQHSESEDDLDNEQRQPSVSPAPVDIPPAAPVQPPSEIQPPAATPTSPITVSPATPSIEQPPVFEFTANSDIHMHSDDLPKPYSDHTQPRIDPIKSSRALSKQTGRHSRSARATAQAAGSKRKLPFPDISELFNLGFDRKDMADSGSGTKRPKHSL